MYLLQEYDFEGISAIKVFFNRRNAIKKMFKLRNINCYENIEAQRLFSKDLGKDFYRQCGASFRVTTIELGDELNR